MVSLLVDLMFWSGCGGGVLGLLGGLVGLFFQESMIWVEVVWVKDGFFGVFCYKMTRVHSSLSHHHHLCHLLLCHFWACR
jgi:hypothetical protein